ncbi:MAG: hypothetical protein OXU23_13070 [Candidatus Poribacteria bacterium]|nr:hypothetical protein [Candidatus Poribacteria bacterium]
MKLVKLLLIITMFCAVTLFGIEQALALEEFVPIDLEPYSNTKLVGHQWWTLNAGDNTYSLLPIGEIGEFEGPDKKVKFQIIDGGIVLFGTNAQRWPKAVNDIVVEGVAKSIYFFHATGWSHGGGPSYKFVMNYRGGKQETLEMTTGFNSHDWCHIEKNFADKNSVWGWKAHEKPACNKAGLITTKWENPHPNTEIVSIDAVSLETGAVPIITSISLGEGSLDVHPVQKLSLTWGSLKHSFGQ